MPAVARPTAALEKAGIPSTLIVTPSFKALAEFIGEGEGVSGLSVVSFPGVFSLETEASFRAKLEESALDDIIAGLTQTIEIEEDSGKVGASRGVIFKGTSAEVNDFFIQNKWTDGLPLIPPTVEKVQEFLKYTDYPPDREIAVLPPQQLRATPWNIAVNGVMAGCRPEFMPVLIAITEAIAGEAFNLRNINTTWGNLPFIIVNGPIVQQLGIEHGIGAISLGPNPALGRALGLIVRNIAGYRPGETYMGTWGYNLPFVIAEDEEESPWESYHVQKGFDKKTSTVTAMATFNWGPQLSFNDVKSVEGALLWLSSYAARIIDFHHPWSFSTTHFVMFLTPPTARMFADAGMSKQDLIKYLWKNTTVTVGEANSKYLDGIIDQCKPVRSFLKRGNVDEATIREFEAIQSKGPDGVLRKIIKPEAIDIVVTGDTGRDKAQWFWTWYNYPVTKEIKLPAKWNKLTRGIVQTG